MSHLSSLCSLFSPPFNCSYDIIHLALLLSLTCVSLSHQVSVEWCYSVCCPLFSVLSNPSWSRRMAILPESDSARGFFLLKGSCSFPQSPQARSGREIGLKTSFGAICWFPELGYCFWISTIWMNWIILKLINWISLDYDYNELNSNWLELDYII